MKITDKFVFFWGNADIYSNWHPAKFMHDGHEFANSEQAMMYEKAKLMGDNEIIIKILETTNPKKVKDLGRKVKFWKQSLWDDNCIEIMVKVCKAKFEANPALKQQLKDTGNRILAEASPYDKIWGIGMKENDNGVEDPSKWNGQNLLGKALMIVRDSL